MQSEIRHLGSQHGGGIDWISQSYRLSNEHGILAIGMMH